MTQDIDRAFQADHKAELIKQVCDFWVNNSSVAKQLWPDGNPTEEDATFIRQRVKAQGVGYSTFALDEAGQALLVARKAEADKAAAQVELMDRIQDYFKEHGIATDDVAISLVEELQKQNPAFNFDQFVVFAQLNAHRFTPIAGRFKAFDLLGLVRHASVEELVRLEQRYGSAIVQNALDQLAARVHKGTEAIQDKRAAEGVTNAHSSYTEEDRQADQKKRQADLEKSPLWKLRNASLRRECENVPFSFRVCIAGSRQDHSATAEGRQILQGMLNEGFANGTPLTELRDQLRAEADRLAGIR